jgi:MYXO-CTERM domain-containing protein
VPTAYPSLPGASTPPPSTAPPSIATTPTTTAPPESPSSCRCAATRSRGLAPLGLGLMLGLAAWRRRRR